jgi:hypothetical protein
MMNSKIKKVYVDVFVFMYTAVSMVTAYDNCQNNHAFFKKYQCYTIRIFIYITKTCWNIKKSIFMLYVVHDTEYVFKTSYIRPYCFFARLYIREP